MKKLTLAIDVGTSSVKLLLTNGAQSERLYAFQLGKKEYFASNNTGILEPRKYADSIWKGIRQWLSKNQNKSNRIGTVVCTGHGQSALLLDDKKELIGKLHRWDNPVNEALLDHYETFFPEEWRKENLSCILPSTGAWQPIRLRNWIASNSEEANRLEKNGGFAIQIKDLLNLDLTGIVASDPRSMRGWLNHEDKVPELLQSWIGLGKITPELFQPHQELGAVTEFGSQKSGIPIGATVLVGCDDLSAGILGLEPKANILLNLANTSEHLAVIPSFHQLQDARIHAQKTGLCFLPSCGDLPPLLYSATSSGGRTLELCLPRIKGWPENIPEEDEGRMIALDWLNEILGDFPQSDELNLAPDFDAEIHGRRGLNPEPTHIGGWEFDPNSAGLDARIHGWVIINGLIDSLEPLKDALLPFTNEDESARIGGGLAMITPVLGLRGARWSQGVTVWAGNDVSARGAAKLAGVEF